MLTSAEILKFLLLGFGLYSFFAAMGILYEAVRGAIRGGTQT